jgi:peroxiredoxin Q/BCP
MKGLDVGEKAPYFEGNDHAGNGIKIDDFRGKKLVLFFYPKDMTPGCTQEVCNLRDHYKELKDRGYELVGVSPDSPGSHEKFIDKYGLPFPLIADEEKKILRDYGVWGEKKMYGKTFMGVNRTTFVIDEKGTIERVFKKVKTKDHAAQILDAQ